MRRSLTLILVLISSASFTATPAPADAATDNYAPVVGVWKANEGSLPLMTLTVEEQNGKLTGAVLFFLIRRPDSGPKTATPGVPEPLIDPTFDGKTLSFKVSHEHAHPGSQNDQPVAFHFSLSADGKIKALGPDGQQVELDREAAH